MAITVVKYNYGQDAKIREYQVEDDFLELLHMLKDNGAGQFDSIVYKITDVIVNSLSNDTGVAWEHDHSTMFSMGRSKEAAVNHLIEYRDEEGADDEEMSEMYAALKKAGASIADYQNRPTDEEGEHLPRDQKLTSNKPLSDDDKNKLRGQAGITRQ